MPYLDNEMHEKDERVFFELLKAGLWERSALLLPFETIHFEAVFNLALEQSVTGLIAAGLENVVDMRPAQKDVMPFIGRALHIEQKNQAMNRFIRELTEDLNKAGIKTLLVKGQGTAQCYERPLLRSSGDVDFLLDAANYEKAKALLSPLAVSVEPEGEASLHYGMTIDSWKVELHGSLRCGLDSRMDMVIDTIQHDTFENGNVRVWKNDGIDILLPGVDNDIVFIFTHFLKHYYKGGIGLRQICDWCRLLWTNRGMIDVDLLEKRLRNMKLMSEWKCFAAFAVEWLGMPIEAMPLYSSSKIWIRKAGRISRFIMEVGNFGQNRDMSYYSKYSYVVRKAISLWRRTGDVCRHMFVFPLDSIRFLPNILFNGLRSAARGE